MLGSVVSFEISGTSVERHCSLGKSDFVHNVSKMIQPEKSQKVVFAIMILQNKRKIKQ